MNRFSLLIFTAFILIGCGGGSGGTVDENSNNFFRQDKSININNSNRVYRVKNAKNTTLELNIDSKKDLFIVVTSKFNNQNISISSASLDNKNSSLRDTNSKDKRVLNTILMRREINEILFSNISSQPRMRQINIKKRDISSVNNNTKANFCIDMDSNHNCKGYIRASIKKVVKNIQTSEGIKSLVVWLEDGNSLSQVNIDNLANIFLKSGSSNDIYDWVSNVYGEEWEDRAQEIDSKLITKSDIIDILVYNMENNGLAGYFWGKDNFKKSAVGASNEKIMFYINSELLKKDPKETYTTLAHEFQHMIHFYQRSVIKGIEDSAWYDELMSEATEDLVATKIEYMGPRHVNPYNGTAGRAGNRKGRYPNFNRYNTVALTMWQNTTRDYSKVSAFGTYLLRNYGGASLLHKMMYSNNQDEYALIDATGENNFGTLIANWGSAVILSDIVNPGGKYQYNFGDFKYTSFKNTTYELGSINFFNYTPQPQFKSSANLDANANLYYKIGDNLSGTLNLNINIPKGADITIIAK